MMNYDAKIYVAGHEGLLGRSLVSLLKELGYQNIVAAPFAKVDLRNQAQVDDFFMFAQPEYVFLTAAKVGSIKDYIDNPLPYLYDNLMIQNNVMKAALECGAKKMVFYATACIYSDRSAQPIKESQLTEFPLDSSSEPYALAKLAGLRMGEYFSSATSMKVVSAVPINLYGPETVHQNVGVMAALVKRFSDAVRSGAPEVVVWGSGNQRREFLHARDMARASLFLMNEYTGAGPVNVGSGEDVSIKELAELIKKLTGFDGTIVFDTSQPEGASQKLLDCTTLKNAGWVPKISLEDGIQEMITLYQADFQALKTAQPLINYAR